MTSQNTCTTAQSPRDRTPGVPDCQNLALLPGHSLPLAPHFTPGFSLAPNYLPRILVLPLYRALLRYCYFATRWFHFDRHRIAFALRLVLVVVHLVISHHSTHRSHLKTHLDDSIWRVLAAMVRQPRKKKTSLRAPKTRLFGIQPCCGLLLAFFPQSLND